MPQGPAEVEAAILRLAVRPPTNSWLHEKDLDPTRLFHAHGWEWSPGEDEQRSSHSSVSSLEQSMATGTAAVGALLVSYVMPARALSTPWTSARVALAGCAHLLQYAGKDAYHLLQSQKGANNPQRRKGREARRRRRHAQTPVIVKRMFACSSWQR